mmetsp:Transcript_25435/g.42042  ORF Transcript_25435/g.42042 Transcript_25435/m.42042 type:complete len:89 (-) Transcript_25435:297-563(-)
MSITTLSKLLIAVINASTGSSDLSNLIYVFTATNTTTCCGFSGAESIPKHIMWTDAIDLGLSSSNHSPPTPFALKNHSSSHVDKRKLI